MIWALHGMFGSVADFEEADVRAVNLWEEGAPFEVWAEGFTARVRKEDRAPSLLGYSMGGRLALHALLAAPDLWKGAVIVSAHPGLEDAAERVARVEADAQWARRAREEPMEEVLREWEAQGVLEGFRKEFDRARLERRRAEVARSFEEWSLGRQEPLWERLGEIVCPVLWVSGERDETFTKLAERAITKIPRGEHDAVPGCGHRVPWEDPERFWEIVGEWSRCAG